MSYEEQIKQAEEYAERQRIKCEIRKIKHKYDDQKKPLPTSKLVTVYLFVVLNIVLIYAMVAMWYFQDLSTLGILITDIAGQIITLAIYMRKSTAENCAGGITYELAMRDKECCDVPASECSADDDSVG